MIRSAFQLLMLRLLCTNVSARLPCCSSLRTTVLPSKLGHAQHCLMWMSFIFVLLEGRHLWTCLASTSTKLLSSALEAGWKTKCTKLIGGWPSFSDWRLFLFRLLTCLRTSDFFQPFKSRIFHDPLAILLAFEWILPQSSISFPSLFLPAPLSHLKEFFALLSKHLPLNCCKLPLSIMIDMIATVLHSAFSSFSEAQCLRQNRQIIPHRL